MDNLKDLVLAIIVFIELYALTVIVLSIPQSIFTP
jgi:hypothetical protein